MRATGEPSTRPPPAQALRECHEALRDFHGSLPGARRRDRGRGAAGRLAAEEDSTARPPRDCCSASRSCTPMLGDAALPDPAAARRRAPQQRAQRPRRPAWNDWEDTCLGPVGWDAACLIAARRDGGERAEAACAASGIAPRPGGAELWVEARALQVAVWRAYLSYVVTGTQLARRRAPLDARAVDEQRRRAARRRPRSRRRPSARSGSPRSARPAARCRPRQRVACASWRSRPGSRGRARRRSAGDVLIRPDARPASCGSTPATAAIVIGTNANPSPKAEMQRREQDVADVGAAGRDLREPAAGRSRSAAGPRSAPA